MDSRTVLVTGANRGLGLEFVRQYADDGWRVFAACRVPKSARELKELESRHAGRIAVLALDVTDQESVKAAAGHLRGEPIDLLLNNAGVGGPPRQRDRQPRLRGLGAGARRQRARARAHDRGIRGERREGA